VLQNSGVLNNGRITVFGGEQLRPNLHVDDMTDLYLLLLDAPDETINGKVWNAGYDNLKVRTIADMVPLTGVNRTLLRRGLRKTDFPTGTEVIVEGYRSKSGAPRANGKTLTFADGRNFFLGASDNPASEGAK